MNPTCRKTAIKLLHSLVVMSLVLSLVPTMTQAAPPEAGPAQQADDSITLTLRAIPRHIPADGSTEATVWVRARDESRQSLPDGTTLVASTTLGRLAEERATTRDGVARFTLVAGQETGTAIVTVRAGSATHRVAVELVEPDTLGTRVSDTPDVPPFDPDERAEIARHPVSVDSRGTARAEGESYAVRFDGDQLTFDMSESEGREQREASLGFTLLRVRVGRRVIFESGRSRAEVGAEENRVFVERVPGLDEEYAALDAGVKQSFTLHRPLAPGRGDLVIEGQFHTTLEPRYLSDDEGILFLDGKGRELLAYTGAVVRDDLGREIFAQLELEGERVSLTVPGEWLAQAEYPVVVDPFIGDVMLVSVGPNYSGSPEVTYNLDDDEWLVVWKDNRNGGDFDVYGQRVQADGTLAGNNFPIVTASGFQKHSDVAYSSAAGQYMVVWEDYRNNNLDVYGRRVTAGGVVTGSEITISVGSHKPAVTYQPATEEWLVVWNAYQARGRRVSSDGEMTGPSFDISQNTIKDRPDVAANPEDGEYLVVWYQKEGTDEYRVRARRVLTDGTLLGSELVLSPANNEGQWPRVTYNGNDDEYLVVWQDERNGNWDIYGQRVTASGVLTGSNFTISSAAGDETRPSITWDGRSERYLVGWQGWGLGQRVWADGTLDGGPIEPSASVGSPDHAYGQVSGIILGVGEIYGCVLAQRYGIQVADFSATPLTGTAPLTATFTNLSTPLYTTMGYTWTFGDGATSTLTEPVHVYTTTGVYTVTLTVQVDDESDTLTRTNYITVTSGSCDPPVADFGASPLSGSVPLTVIFTDASSGTITGRSWDFGDGGSSGATNPSHVYTGTGVYTVSLTATGPGGTDTLTRTNYIAVAEPISGTALSLEKQVAPWLVLAGEVVTYTLVVSNHSGLAVQDGVLVDQVPQLVEVLEAQGATYDPGTRELRWEPVQLAPDEALTMTIQAQVTTTAVMTVVQNSATFASAALSETTVASATLLVGEMVTGTLTPEGGELTSLDGRVHVEAPPAAVTETVAVSLTGYPAQSLGPGELGDVLYFDLAPDLQFALPVTVSVVVSGLIDYSQWQHNQRVYLAYMAGPEQDDWEAVPNIVLDAEQPLPLVAQVDHFSTWKAAVGEEQGAWQFTYNSPAVSLFSGAATYNYPIEIPPGRNGLQPQVNLSYSSRRADGLLGYLGIDAGPLGVGWSVDQMDITRVNIGGGICGAGYTCFNDKHFVLTLNGTGYDLKPAGSSMYWGRFYAKDAPGLYVERRNYCDVDRRASCLGNPGDGSPENVTGDYWIVRLPDGTEARLGYTENSEQVVAGVSANGGYGGEAAIRAVKRWRVDTITDRHENGMAFTYWEHRHKHSDRWSLLRRIEYNQADNGTYLTQVAFGNNGNVDELGVGPLYTVIQILDRGQLLREYRLDVNRTTSWECGTTLERAHLDEIQVYDGSRTETLPATTFSYAWLSNWTVKPHPCFTYPRLSEVDNGYGGSTEFSYAGDGYSEPRRCGLPDWPPEYFDCPGLDSRTVGQSYWVTEMRTYDGLSATPARVTYQYSDGCHGNRHSPCAGPGAVDWATLVGFGSTTERLYAYDGNLVTRRQHSFHTDYAKLGREYRVQAYDSDGITLLQRADTDWSTSPLGDTTFVHLDQVTTTDYSGGDTVTTRVTYDYDGYGNVTHARQYESAGATTPYRTTETSYVASTDPWIVGRPSAEILYDASGQAQARSYFYYDGQPHGSAPVRGDLTQVDAWMLGGPYRTTYEYDEYGNVVAQTNALGRSTTTGYDSTFHLFPLQVCNALGQCARSEYYGVNESSHCIGEGYHFGAVCRAYGPNGTATATRYAYDDFGRLTSVVRPGDSPDRPATEYEYHDGALFWVRTRQREVSGQAGTLDAYAYYDGLGRAIQTRAEAVGSDQWVVGSSEYDALGRAVRGYVPRLETGYSRTTPAGDRTITQYDALGRVVQVTNPDGTHTATSYDGWTTTATDANGHWRSYTNDAFGRLVTVVENNPTTGLPGYQTTYAYDVLDNLTGVWDAADGPSGGNHTQMAYDPLGRKTWMDDPDMGEWSYGYDVVGNLITQTDAFSQTLVFEYDELNRLERKRVSESASQPLAIYRYDEVGHGYSVGQRTSMEYTSTLLSAGPNGSAAYRYDERGRLVEETRTFDLDPTTGPLDYQTGYTYDALDRVLTMTYPDGEVVTQSYDGRGLPGTLTSSLGETFVESTTYNPLGQIDLMGLGNGLDVDYQYYTAAQDNNRLEHILISGLLDLSYAYDDVGNVTSIVDGQAPGGTQTQVFTYDALDRLVTAGATGGSAGTYDRTYNYDAIGNLDWRVNEGQTVDYDYTGAGPHAVTGLSDGSHFAYDANGNMTLRVEISGTQTITYVQEFDIENRLAAVTSTTGLTQTVTRFGYDGDGARVWQATEEGTTIYVGEYYEEFVAGAPLGIQGGGPEARSAVLEEARLPESDAGAESESWGGRVPGMATLRPSSVAAGPQQTWGDEFISGHANGWSWSQGFAGPPYPFIEWNDNGNLYLHTPERTRQFALVGRNDAFDASGTSRYYLEIRFRFPQVTGYSSGISVGSATFSTDWHDPGAPSGAADVLDVNHHQLSYRIKVFNDTRINLTPGDTGWHTARMVVANGQFAIWLDDVFQASGAATAAPRFIYVGLTGTTDYYGNWTSERVDYVRVGTPETDAPGSWQNLIPSGWTRDRTPDVTLQVRDTGTGLDVSTAQYHYSTNGGSSWSSWSTASCTGSDGTTAYQTLSAYNVPFNQDADTQNRIQFRIRDLAGNWGASSQYTIRVDATPPDDGSILINGGANWTNSPAVTLTLSATDPAPGSGLYQMRFCNDTNDCSDEGSGWSSWRSYSDTTTWTLPDEQGERRVYVRFRDVAGNVSTLPASSDIIGLDTQPPTSTLVYINDDALATNSRTVQLTLSASDPWPNSGVSQMRIWNDGESEPTTWISYTTSFNQTLRDEDGDRTVYVRFRDGAGNTTVCSDTIELDRDPPSLTVTHPDDELPLGTLPLTVKGQSEISATVQVGVPESGWQSILLTLEDGVDFGFRVDELVQGENTIVVTATDQALNSTIVTRTVFYDAVGPRIDDLTPAGTVDDTRPTISASFAATGTAVVSPTTAHITLDGQDVTTDATVTADGFTYTPADPLEEGDTPFVEVEVYDTAGNRGEETWQFQVDLSTWVTITHPSEEFNRLSATVEGWAEPGVTVTLQVDGDPAGTTQAGAESGHYSIPGVTLSAGGSVLVAAAEDSLGHTAAATRTVTVDLAAPWAEAQAYPPIFSPGGALGSTTFVLTATAPAGESLAGWRFTVEDGSTVVTQTGGAGAPAPSLAWDGHDEAGQPLDEGVYDYTLVVTATNDHAYGMPPRQVTLDLTPPAAPIITQPTSGTTSSQGLIWVQGTAEPGAFITLLDGGSFTTTLETPTGADGHWAGEYPLHGGRNHITAVADDTTGVTSPPSNEIVVVHVVHPPLYDVGTDPTTVAAGGETTLWADVRGEDHPDGEPTTGAWAYPPYGDPVTLTHSSAISGGLLWHWDGAWGVPTGLPSHDTTVAFEAVDADNLSGDGEIGVAIRNVPLEPAIVYPPEHVVADPHLSLEGRVQSAERLTVRVWNEDVQMGQTRSVGWNPTLGINWQVAITLTGEGLHPLSADSVSDFGLTSDRGPAVTFLLDTQPPTVTLAALPAFTNTESLPLAWQGEDGDGSGVMGYGLEHQLDGGSWRMRSSGGPGYTFTPFGLYPEGVHGFRVWAQDEALHQAWSGEQTVVADRTPPTVTLTLSEHSDYAHASDDTLYYAENSGSFTVTAALTDTLARLAQVTFPDTTSPGISYTLSGLTSATRFCTYTFTEEVNEEGVYEVAASDRATNVGTGTFTVTRDTAPPTFTLSPAVESGALRVTWSSTDAASGVDASTCELRVQEDEGAWQPFSTDCAGDEIHSAAQPGHVYTFRLSASDNVSNSASAEALARFPRVTKYYYHGGQRVAMRADGVVYYLHGDHLGSTSLTTDASGAVVARQLYHPYGTVRHSEGTLPTDFGFTGQRGVPGTGLVFMHARYYHLALARFTQADTIVPDFANPQSLNRYLYVYNRPLVYIDPDGHFGIVPIIGLIAVGIALLVMTSDVAPPPDSPVAHSRAGNQRVGEKALMVAASSGLSILYAPVIGGTGAATTAAELLMAELADGDDDEAQIAQKAQELLGELQTAGGRMPLDELDDRVMARLQQLGQAANRNEEFAVYVTQGNQMSLVQTSRYGGAPPADAAQWLLHTHFGTGVAPSGNDQVILSALGARSGQFHFSTIVDSQGNSTFFLPWPLEKWLEIQ